MDAALPGEDTAWVVEVTLACTAEALGRSCRESVLGDVARTTPSMASCWSSGTRSWIVGCSVPIGITALRYMGRLWHQLWRTRLATLRLYSPEWSVVFAPVLLRPAPVPLRGRYRVVMCSGTTTITMTGRSERSYPDHLVLHDR